jgi:hypothetical protein
VPLVAAAPDDLLERLAAVAEEHAPDGGYGNTYWRAETGTLFWISADWSSDDEVHAARDAFFAVDEAVREFETETEVAAPAGAEWSAVWVRPNGVNHETVNEGDLHSEYEDVLALAREPLPDLEPEDWGRYRHTRDRHKPPEGEDPAAPALPDPNVTAALEALASHRDVDRTNLRAVLSQLAEAHRTTIAAMAEAITASAAPVGNAEEQTVLTAAALGVMSEFARRPEPRQPDIFVSVPERKVDVHVAAAEAPHTQVDVHVPEQAPLPAPHVEVVVPEQRPPDIHLTAAVPSVIVEAPSPTPVEVTVNVPDEIHTIPAETETVAERDRDGLVKRSVTRPTGG